MELGDDPEKWSVDEVVHALCHATEIWLPYIPESRRKLPDLKKFEEVLRTNGIDGFALKYIKETTLREEFGVPTFAQQLTILQAIDNVRQWPGRKLQINSAANRNHESRREESEQHSPPHQQSPRQQSPQQQSPQQQSPQPRQLNGDKSSALPINQSSSLHHAAQGSTALVLPENRHPSDVQQAKKRRIELTVVKFNNRSSVDDVLFGNTIHGGELNPDITILEQNEEFMIFGNSESLAKSKFAYKSMVCAFKFLSDESNHFEGAEEGTSEPVGLIIPLNLNQGHSLKRSRRQKDRAYFPLLHIDPIVLTADEDNIIATRGFPMSLPPGHQQDDMQTPGAHAFWKNQLGDRPHSTPMNDNHTDGNDEDEVMEYDESDEDSGEMDVSDNGADEVDSENEVKPDERLSDEDIIRIIDGAVAEFADEWETTKRPRREDEEALAVWKSGNGRHGRQILIERLLSPRAPYGSIPHFEAYLDKLRENIIGEARKKSEESLRRQCDILGMTVYNRQEALWKIDVLKRSQPPLPPTKRRTLTVGTRKRKRSVVNESDTESDTESDAKSDVKSDASDDMADFIVDDDASNDLVVNKFQRFSDGSTIDSPDRNQDGDILIDGDFPLVLQDDPQSDAAVTTPATLADPDDLSSDRVVSKEGRSVVDASPTAPEPAQEPAHPTLAGSQLNPKTPAKPPFNISTSATVISLSSDTEFSPAKGAAQRNLDLSPLSKLSRLTISPRPKGHDQVVLDWGWAELEEEERRLELLEKMIRTRAPQSIFNTLNAFLTRKDKNKYNFWDGVSRALNAIKVGDCLRGESETSSATYFFAAKLFIAYDLCDHAYISEQAPDFDEDDCQKLIGFIREPMKLRGSAKTFLQNAQIFVGRGLITIPEKKHQMSRSPDSESEDELDAEALAFELTPRKRKTVKMSEETKVKVRAAQLRMQKSNLTFQASSPVGLGNSSRMVRVNSQDQEKGIFIDPHIGSQMYKHQIEGVRFMWREVVNGGGGCLLAHTMGLGKTIQSITLLLTIADACQDEDGKAQIPKALQPKALQQKAVQTKAIQPKLHAVLVCPPALIKNWEDELKHWVPASKSHLVSPVRLLDREVPAHYRALVATDWVHTGGTLIVGYPLLAMEKGKTDYAEAIFNAATIVIADEAHMMKNTTGRVRGVMGQFKTRSRIALTGTPLSNNLEEYYSLIDWVDPDYLGSLLKFRAIYQNPITNGLYKNCDKATRRRALKLLEVLKRTIAPKVQFRDMISVISDPERDIVLPPKVEFLIHVPLTEVQKAVYECYVQWFLDKGPKTLGEQPTPESFLTGIGDLGLVCNHPILLLDRIEKRLESKNLEVRNQPGSPLPGQDSEKSEDTGAENGVAFTPVANSLVILRDKIVKIIEEMVGTEGREHSLSHQMDLFVRLVQSTISAKEKLLVYSASIPVLNYVQTLLTSLGISSLRVDGQVPSQWRQGLSKQFNKGDVPVFLISAAGGTGFNLPGASRVVIFDLAFNPSYEEQAIGRAYRLGQKKDVFVYRFIAAGTSQEKLKNVQIHKKQLFIQALDNMHLKSAATKPKDYFDPPKDADFKTLDEFKGKDSKVLDQILRISSTDSHHPSITEIETTETFRIEEEDEFTKDEIEEAAEEVKRLESSPELLRQLQTSSRLGVYSPYPSSAMAPASSQSFGVAVQQGPYATPSDHHFATPFSHHAQPHVVYRGYPSHGGYSVIPPSSAPVGGYPVGHGTNSTMPPPPYSTSFMPSGPNTGSHTLSWGPHNGHPVMSGSGHASSASYASSYGTPTTHMAGAIPSPPPGAQFPPTPPVGKFRVTEARPKSP